MEEGRLDNGAKRKAREKRRKCARGGPRGMEEAEAAGNPSRFPRSPEPDEHAFPTGAQFGNWEPRRLGQRAKPETVQSEAGLGVRVSKDLWRRNAPRKVVAPKAEVGAGIGRWTGAGHPRVPSAPAGEGRALQPEPKLGIREGREASLLRGLWAEVPDVKVEEVWAFGQALGSGRSQSPGAEGLPSRRTTGEVCCPSPWSNAGGCLRPLPSDLDVDRACGKVGPSRWNLEDVAIKNLEKNGRLTFSHTCPQFILLALLCQLSLLLLSSLSPSFTLCLTILALSPVPALPRHRSSPHQPSLVCKPLQSVLPSPRSLPFLPCHSLLAFAFR